MAEYIYTNLPQYVNTNSRTEFSSSVVSSGAVLLFSENGSSLTAKLPDGSFVDVGGGSGGTDVSPTTAEAVDVLAGKIFFTSGGVQTSGTIPTVTATSAGSQITVPAGYIATSQTFNVSGGIDVGSTTAEAPDVVAGKVFYDSAGTLTSGTIPTVSASLSANVTTVPAGYIASAQTLTVPLASSATVAGGIVTIPAGYVASDYTVSVGSGGSSTDFFKCATVTSGGSTWTGYKAVLTSGKYEYASSATSGLVYGSGFTPEVGKVYADGALVRAFLYDGVVDGHTVLYIPMYGTDPFQDKSYNAYAVTNAGATAVTNVYPAGSPGSGLFDGPGDYLLIPQRVISSAMSEFTLEVEYYLNTLPSKSSSDSEQWNGGYYLLATGPDLSMYGTDILLLSDGISINFNDYDNDRNTINYTQTTGTWRRLKITRASDGTVSVYVDGTLIDSYLDYGDGIYNGAGLAIARVEPYGEAGTGWDGYMANYKISDVVR